MRFDRTEFAERLRELLCERGETQKDLAEAIGVSRGCVTLYCNSMRTPNIEKLAKIAEHFDVDMDWLVFGKESEE